MKTSSNSARLSRRHFLRRALTAATASVALPYFIPSGVLAAPGRPGANDRIGVGIIGLGRQATGLLDYVLKLPQAQYVAVADVNLARARASAQKHGVEAFQDYRKLLDLKSVDAIITATPEQWRSNICIHACQAGKDVYAEKPMTLTILEGRLMVQAARKYKRVFQVGSQQRSLVRNRVGCELIRNGKLGKITHILAHNYPSPWESALPAETVPADLDWDMWCGPAPLVPYNKDLYLPRANPGWLSFRPYSGGEMTGWGAHGFDQVQWALGMDDSGPIEVWVEGDKYDPPTYAKAEPKERGDKICTNPKVFFRYPGNIIMELADGPGGGAVFTGEKGKITINRGVCEGEPDGLVEDALRAAPKGEITDHMKNWLDCIKSRAKPIADVEIGHRSSTVCHLGNIARWTHRRLEWDPVQEVFPKDKDVNAYLDRERRKPWTLPEKI